MNPSPSSGSASDGSASDGPAPQPPAEHRPAPAGSHPAGDGPKTGSSPAGAPGSGGFHSGFHSWVRSLRIVRGEDRWFGGVATGIAARTGLDPVLIRGLFVVLGIFGIGFLVYGVAWALLPEPDGRIHLEEAVRGTWTSGMTGALIFAILGVGGPGIPFLGSESWLGGIVWTLFWVGAGVAAISWFSTGKAWPHLSGHGNGPEAGDPAAGSTSAGDESANGPGTGAAASGKPVTLSKSGTTATGQAPAEREPATSSAHPVHAAAPGDLSGTVQQAPSADREVPADTQGGSGGTAKKHGRRASGPVAAALFGAGLLAGGAVLALDYVNVLSLGSPFSVALAAAAVVFGAGVTVLGLAGRNGSGIGAAAVIALVAAFLTQGAWTNANMIVAGNRDWTPRDAAEASAGYTYVAGNGVLDLRATESSGDFEVPASVAMGNIDILVPEDSPVTVHFGMAAGSVNVQDGEDYQSYGGLWQPAAEHTLNDGADGDRITIDVRGLASNVLITTEESDL